MCRARPRAVRDTDRWDVMRRKSTMTLGTFAPWWLLFVAFFFSVALHHHTYDAHVRLVPSDHTPEASPP